MQWLNPAPAWDHTGDIITITSGPKTDFWRTTHSGHVSDNGHFYYQPVTGDFVADVHFSAAYAALYDQAGLMVRLDSETWMKCGIELFNGAQHVSTVVTRRFSDWSLLPLVGAPPALHLRVKRHGDTLDVSYSLAGDGYVMLRQAYFPPEPTLQVGVMACAPTGDGFTATFEDFTVRALEE